MKKGRNNFVIPLKNVDSSIPVDNTKSNDKPKSVPPPPPPTTKKTTKASKIPLPPTFPTANATNNNNNIELTYFKVMFCERSNKKHKIIQEDGYVYYNESKKFIELLDADGKDIGKSLTLKLSDIKIDVKCNIGSKEVTITEQISKDEFLKIKNSTTKLKNDDTSSDKKPMPSNSITTTTITTGTTAPKEFKSHALPNSNTKKSIQPRNDPNTPGAMVLSSPSDDSETHVVVDQFLSQQLRPHQKFGVQFMWDCITGQANEYGTGTILADQMGLGKTLQTITLIWTALKQSKLGTPLVKKVIIVTPTNLIENWKKEIKQWLGNDRLKPFTLTDSVSKKTKQMMEDFKTSKIYPILIISYEQCRVFSNILETLNNIGLLVCDEGHRLKNSTSQTTLSINSIKATKRILISGTPIQNDLVEFHTMVDFVNPGCLDSISSFKRSYIQPIMKFREGNDPKGEGLERSKELSEVTKSFIIRRKSNLLEQYLPTKTTHVIFCKPSKFQAQIYSVISKSKPIQALLSSKKPLDSLNEILSRDGEADEDDNNTGSGNLSVLSIITILKKLSNSSKLIRETEFYPNLPNEPSLLESSSKIQFINQLIKTIQPKNEKLVLVSNYTQTLDILQEFLKELNIEFFRLDGTVNPEKRQQYIDQFNSSVGKFNVFMLSSRAGGVGINLIGGNHLVLFDPDWNPAIDQQAMARVWREGQTKPVSIYRLLTSGTIDEKIFQRQLSKEYISNSIIDKIYNEKKSFSQDELADLFSFNESTQSETHDLLQCKCQNNTNTHSNNNNTGIKKEQQKLFKEIDHLTSWDHFNNLTSIKNHYFFNKESNNDLKNIISFLFISKQSKSTNYNNNSEEISFLKTESNDNVDDTEETNIKTPIKKNNKKKVKEEVNDDEEIEVVEEEPELINNTAVKKDSSEKTIKKRKIIMDEDEDDIMNLEFQ